MNILKTVKSWAGLTAVVALLGLVWLTAPVAQAWVFQWTQNWYVAVSDGWSSEDISLVWTGWSTLDGLVAAIKWAINWALGILAFIALIVLLYGWFLMVTAAWESEKYDKWFTILKQAAVGLVLIGVAWFVVSIVFWLINLTAQPAQSWWAGTDA